VTRVLILTPCAIVHGGVERVIESLNDGLPARGFEVTVGLAKGARFHDANRYRAAYPSLRSIDLDATTGSREGRRRAIAGALDRVRPDIVLVSRLADALEVVARRKAGGDPMKVVFAIAVFESEYFVDLARFRPFIDGCVTAGRLIADAAVSVGDFPAERVRSIPPGVRPPRRFVEDRGAAPIRIGYVGRLDEPQKRVLDIPRILRRLADRGVPFSCTIAGDGPAEPELRQLVSALGLSDHVRFLGSLDLETLDDHVYPGLDVFLHCAAWEGYPGAPCEAMVHGDVLVVSRFASLVREGLFRDRVNVRTFPIGDWARAADLVAELDRDRDQWKSLSEAAKSEPAIRTVSQTLDEWAAFFST
jgi:glycosyltransferase involved in cell wall biosynthesis